MHQALTGDPTAFPTDQRLGLSLCHSPTFSHKSQGLAFSYNLAQLCRAQCVYCIFAYAHMCVHQTQALILRILSGQHTHEWIRLSGNHLLSQSNHILIAVVKDVAACSPTGSNLQRVPVDLLDMWAICLPAVASVSLASIHAQIHTRTKSVAPHMCTLVLYTHTTLLYTSLTFERHTHCISLGSCYLAVWCLLSPLSSLRDKNTMPKHISRHGELHFVWNTEIFYFMFRSMREKW